jgi:hypothetical protein
VESTREVFIPSLIDKQSKLCLLSPICAVSSAELLVDGRFEVRYKLRHVGSTGDFRVGVLGALLEGDPARGNTVLVVLLLEATVNCAFMLGESDKGEKAITIQGCAS